MTFLDPPYGPVALEDRRAARIAGKLNKPIGGPRWVKSMSRVDQELPDGIVTSQDKARWEKRWRQDGHSEPQMGLEIVLIVLPSQPVPKRTRRAWRGRGRSGN